MKLDALERALKFVEMEVRKLIYAYIRVSTKQQKIDRQYEEIKALLKMWVLQFKNGVKSDIRIEWEEDEQKLADKKAELANVEAQLPEFEKIFREVGNRILGEAAAECNKLMRTNNELINKIKEISHGFVRAQSFIAKEIKDTNLFKMDFNYYGPTMSDLTGTIYISFETVFGESVKYHWSSIIDRTGYDFIHKRIDIEGMTVDKIREEAEKVFTGLATVIKPQVGNISHTELIKTTYDKTVKTIEDGKKAQAAVNAGKTSENLYFARKRQAADWLCYNQPGFLSGLFMDFMVLHREAVRQDMLLKIAWTP